MAPAWPAVAASNSGVCPSQFSAFASAPFASSSESMAGCPLKAARCSGVVLSWTGIMVIQVSCCT